MTYDYQEFFKKNKFQLKEFILAQGFKENPSKPDLFSFWYRDDNVTLYHDLRGVTRRSYAFKKGSDGPFKHENLKEYMVVVDFEEKLKDEYLGAEKYVGASENDPLVAMGKEVDTNMPPTGNDKHEEILYHASNIIKAIKTHNLVHHYEKLNELLKKSGYKLRGDE